SRGAPAPLRGSGEAGGQPPGGGRWRSGGLAPPRAGPAAVGQQRRVLGPGDGGRDQPAAGQPGSGAVDPRGTGGGRGGAERGALPRGGGETGRAVPPLAPAVRAAGPEAVHHGAGGGRPAGRGPDAGAALRGGGGHLPAALGPEP